MSQAKYVNNIFERMVKKNLISTLLNLGFERNTLPVGWIYPTFLYKHQSNGIWFGTSYDWRDIYYEAHLGKLYFFRDVLPRVVILGFDLNSSNTIKNNPNIEEFIEGQINYTINSLSELMTKSNILHERLTEAIDQEKKRLYNYIQQEITVYLSTEKWSKNYFKSGPLIIAFSHDIVSSNLWLVSLEMSNI